MAANATLTPESKFVVGDISNATNHDIVVDYKALLAKALEAHLTTAGLLGSASGGSPITIECRVTDYAPGSAMKRWMMPGWGATKLTVVADLKRDGAVIATVKALRTVEAGGLYTVGDDTAVFDTVGGLIVDEIKKKVTGGK